MKKANKNMNKETLEAMATSLNLSTEGLTKKQLVDAINAAVVSAEDADKTADKTAEDADKTADKTAEDADKTADKTRKPRKRTKKTFEELVATVPLCTPNIHLKNVLKGAVAVYLGHTKLFTLDNLRIVTTIDDLVLDLDAENSKYGFRLAPTAENMEAMIKTAATLVK